MEERRIMAVRDGRRLPPRNSRGEFRRRRSRRDRGMDYGDVTRRGRYGDYGEDMGDYGEDMARGMRGGRGRGRSDYGDYEMDGHYPEAHGSTYYPIQAMGTFEGYYGMPEQDYGMNYRRYGGGYDMRRGGRMRDYGYDYGDDYGDYGETLSDKELEEWCKKLKSKLDEREKQMFSKEMIAQKAKAMGRQMEGFGEKELEVVTLMLYDDYKKTLGANPDLMIKLAFDWLDDKDASVKGAEKLAIYHDEVVMGGEE